MRLGTNRTDSLKTSRVGLWLDVYCAGQGDVFFAVILFFAMGTIPGFDFSNVSRSTPASIEPGLGITSNLEPAHQHLQMRPQPRQLNA